MNVLLTGASGFIGNLIATTFIDSPNLNLTCILRRGLELPFVQIVKWTGRCLPFWV